MTRKAMAAAPLRLPGRVAHQWEAPLRKRMDIILGRLFQALEARTLTFDEAVLGLAQMKAYADLLMDIERDSRQFEAEQALGTTRSVVSRARTSFPLAPSR